MRYRTVKIHSRETFTSDTTKIIDINVKDVISNLVVKVEGTHTGAVMQLHPVSVITDLQVVDGSDVLFSLDGYEAEALDWYNRGGKFRSNYNYACTAGTWTRFIGINFGRYKFDPEYAFDPKIFTNPQLKISLDIDAWSSTGSTVYVTVYANVFDEMVPAPRGFLMAKELKQWTMASSTHEYTDLPTDYPYRALYMRAYLAGTEPNASLSNFKLSEDQDKRIPIDLGAHEMNSNVMDGYPPVEEEWYYSLNTSNRYLYCAPTTRVKAVGAVWATSGVAQDAAFYNGDGGRLNTIAAANPSNTQIFIKGGVVHCTYEISFGDKMNPDDWYDVRPIGSLIADVTGGAAAQGFLFLQQARPY